MLRNSRRVAALLVAVAFVAIGAWCRNPGNPRASRPARQAAAQQSTAAFKFVSPLPNGNWTLPAGDLANTRYDPLSQINTQNVKNLKVIAILSDGIPHGHEGQPLVLNNTLYEVTPYPDELIAYNLKDISGPIDWKFNPHPNPISQGKACCDTVNRGAAYGDGKIVYQALSDMVVAVDAKTGKLDWETKTGNVADGATSTSAPLIVKDKVYVGNSGAEMGVRGKLTCLDLASGKILWTAYSEGPDSDVRINSSFHPFYKKDQGKDLGVTTWTPDQWKHGGGTVWGWISYDPETNLIFYGTSNPGVWNPDQRPGDNKWSITIFARDADTGYAKWAYQIEPHDDYDYDGIMENILVDMNWKGKMRKLLLHPGRNGFFFVLDRETGEVLSAEKFVDSTNWASGYDLKTGLPISNPAKATHQGVTTTDICPSSTGAKEFVPSAVSPLTGYDYIPAHNTCMNYEGLAANYIAGTPYVGANVTMYPGPGGYQGMLEAWDIKTEKPVWSVKDKLFPVYSGVLATGGNVVFYGTMEGWFRALDARTGQILWQFKTPSGIVGDPITYLGPDGHQYVAIYSAIGGWMGATAFPDISISDPTAAMGVVGAMSLIKQYSPPGDNLFIFGL
ncbi:MAG: PQQ-dependent dehydrogenase, methanol/ethanol family [Candidatus Acidiferrales bacterium]